MYRSSHVKSIKAVIRDSCLVFRDPKTWAGGTAVAHGRLALRLLAVLNVRFKYACARQAACAFFLRPACASSWRPFHALRLAAWREMQDNGTHGLPHL